MKKYILILTVVFHVFMSGCGSFDGYSTESLYPEKVDTVYVKMFDNRSFRLGVEYPLTGAIAKRIESDTPYKVVSDRNIADTVLSGQVVSVGESILTLERQTGRAIEKEVRMTAEFEWKNLNTGEYLVEEGVATASGTFSEWQNQGFRYGSELAANNLAEDIVRQMEKSW